MNRLPPSGQKSRIKKSEASSYYTTNEYLLPLMVEYKVSYDAWDRAKKQHELDNPSVAYPIKSPRIPEPIGVAIIRIVTGLATKSNFAYLPYRDDLVGDAIENLVMYAHNFDPQKSSNVFSYFTQTAFYAFLRRIEKEKKQNAIKWDIINTMNGLGSFQEWARSEGIEDTDPASYLKLSETDLVRHNSHKHVRVGRKTKKELEAIRLAKLEEAESVKSEVIIEPTVSVFGV